MTSPQLTDILHSFADEEDAINVPITLSVFRDKTHSPQHKRLLYMAISRQAELRESQLIHSVPDRKKFHLEIFVEVSLPCTSGEQNVGSLG